MNTILKSLPILSLSKKKMDSIRREITKAHDNYMNVLLKRAFYKTSNQEVSQDLVQTTFLKTLTYLQKGGKIDLMSSFLNHILNALIIDEYRKKRTLSLDALLEKGYELTTDDHERTVNILDGKRVTLLIPFLPKKYESILHMKYLQGLSLKEMALLSGQSENTVAVQVHRGLQKLKKLYRNT